MYKKILLPVDTNHEEVAERILALAKTLVDADGEILVTHVVPELPAYGTAYISHDLYQNTMKQARQTLEQMQQKTGIKAELKVEVGVPHTAILDDARSFEPDLIIIGSHKPGLSDYFLGSTAARVVRHAGCSVLVDR